MQSTQKDNKVPVDTAESSNCLQNSQNHPAIYKNKTHSWKHIDIEILLYASF